MPFLGQSFRAGGPVFTGRSEREVVGRPLDRSRRRASRRSGEGFRSSVHVRSGAATLCDVAWEFAAEPTESAASRGLSRRRYCCECASHRRGGHDRNAPWFASIGSLTFEAGGRYAIQVVGADIRPVSLAVRDPSGKFTSSLSPWQWTEANGEQRAITTVSANRPGKWAIEMRLAGNNVRDLKVSALRVGGGGSYEGVVEVGDILSVGESTDVQLGPNEFARLTVKMRSASPQIVQPDVQRYRNKTFQPTAVDMSLWDSRGRLVWSNNRNLEEEVLSGRLGKEPQLSERFATVSNIEPYSLIIDPHTDLAGRFRVSIGSTPVSSDVSLNNGAIALLEGGTKTGVVEIREPSRYRLTGTAACMVSTSLAEWSGNAIPLAAAGSSPASSSVPASGICVRDGSSMSLPVGVHRFLFLPPVVKPAAFTLVPPGSPPDPVLTIEATIDGLTALVPAGVGDARMKFTTTRPSTRLVFVEDGKPVGGSLVLPDGTRRSVVGPFLATLSGTYSFYVGQNATNSRLVSLRSSVSEVQTTNLVVGAKNKILRMQWGQRLEASVGLATRTRVAIDSFADASGSISLAMIADDKERRWYVSGGGTVVLPAGRYRFVFQGDGDVRIALKRLPLLGG